MSTRPASPPPVAKWPFILGDLLLVAVAAITLLGSGTPPGLGAIVVALLCVAGGVGLLITPYLLDNEARVRFAEAAMRESVDTQARRLGQMAEQLTHAVSRSQSTEEQAGQALGTLEELSEKLAAQSEELTQALARSGEREQAALQDEVNSVRRERGTILSALDAHLQALTEALTEAQAAARKSDAGATRLLGDLRARVEALATRLDELAGIVQSALANPPPAAPAAVASAAEPSPLPCPPAVIPITTAATTPPPTVGPDPVVTAAEAPPAPSAEPAAEAKEDPPPPAPATPAPAAEAAPAATTITDAHTAKPARARSRHAAAATPAPAAETSHRPARAEIAEKPEPDRPQPLELGLEGMPEPRPPMRLSRRELAGSTSLVATAYIGIGNKLHLRGEGPGLSWERGVPMQFLAIGKWGWTSTEATAPVVCRIYRNDDTPMLDENLVIAPGTKAEITPRF